MEIRIGHDKGPAQTPALRYIYSQLSRLSTARVSGTGLVTVSPAKVKACKALRS